MDRSDPRPPDYGKHAESVIEVDTRSLATFERSERGEVWRGGAPGCTGGLTDDGKRSDSVWSVPFYYASRREEKGEGLGGERARHSPSPEGWRMTGSAQTRSGAVRFVQLLLGEKIG